MSKTDTPTEMVCTEGEENIMNNVTSTAGTIFSKPLFTLLAKYMYTENQTYPAQ